MLEKQTRRGEEGEEKEKEEASCVQKRCTGVMYSMCIIYILVYIYIYVHANSGVWKEGDGGEARLV